MTKQRDIGHLLDQWFSDGPSAASDRVIDAIADRIERQPQRPAWRLRFWRDLPMNGTLRLALAAAVVLVVGVVGVSILRPAGSGIGGTSATPTTAPSASTTNPPSASPIACENNLPGCLGPLAAGAYRSNNLDPVLFYETTGEWLNVIDLPTIYKIDQPNPADPYVLLWSDAAIPDQSIPCSLEPDPKLGRKAADWIDFLTSHPGLVATEPVAVDFGDTTGQQVELVVAPDWTATCPNHAGFYVMFLTQPIDGRPSEYGLPSDQRVLVTVVDVGDRTVVIESYGPASAETFATTTRTVRDLIATFRFGCGGATGRPCTP